jgi:hypothetical protein
MLAVSNNTQGVWAGGGGGGCWCCKLLQTLSGQSGLTFGIAAVHCTAPFLYTAVPHPYGCLFTVQASAPHMACLPLLVKMASWSVGMCGHDLQWQSLMRQQQQEQQVRVCQQRVVDTLSCVCGGGGRGGWGCVWGGWGGGCVRACVHAYVRARWGGGGWSTQGVACVS